MCPVDPDSKGPFPCSLNVQFTESPGTRRLHKLKSLYLWIYVSMEMRNKNAHRDSFGGPSGRSNGKYWCYHRVNKLGNVRKWSTGGILVFSRNFGVTSFGGMRCHSFVVHWWHVMALDACNSTESMRKYFLDFYLSFALSDCCQKHFNLIRTAPPLSDTVSAHSFCRRKLGSLPNVIPHIGHSGKLRARVCLPFN